jgi:hypothetical protein
MQIRAIRVKNLTSINQKIAVVTTYNLFSGFDKMPSAL